MVCLGLEPGAAGWKAQTNPLSYGGTPSLSNIVYFLFNFYKIKIGSVIALLRRRLSPEIFKVSFGRW